MGSITCDGRPIAIFGWACKIPSTTQMRPKPIRSSCRQAGSAAAAEPPVPAASPAPAAAGSHARTLSQASPSTTKISSAISP